MLHGGRTGVCAPLGRVAGVPSPRPSTYITIVDALQPGFDAQQRLPDVKVPVKCSTAGCHRRKKVSPEELRVLRQEGKRAGRRAGLVCPACVKRALDNPDEYDLDIPLGELLVESARETPRWRVSLTPEEAR